MKQLIYLMTIMALLGIIGLGFVTAQETDDANETEDVTESTFQGCQNRGTPGNCGLKDAGQDCPFKESCQKAGSCGCGCRG